MSGFQSILRDRSASPQQRIETLSLISQTFQNHTPAAHATRALASPLVMQLKYSHARVSFFYLILKLLFSETR